LAVEVSELKRDLQLARGDLQNAKDQAEQYKAISQSSEEELQSMNETQDQYRAEMDRLLAEKDTKIRGLEQRIEDTTSELSSTNTELSTLRDERSEGTRRLEEQKVAFEAEIARLKDEDERHATAAHFHQEDLKVQAEIAQQAQQNYENELVKHAEAAKALQKVRNEHNQLKLEIVELRTEADTAKRTSSKARKAGLRQGSGLRGSWRTCAFGEKPLMHRISYSINSSRAFLGRSRPYSRTGPTILKIMILLFHRLRAWKTFKKSSNIYGERRKSSTFNTNFPCKKLRG
jgi:predicted  nucleic acid-binding Zn-ribbon protein